MKRTLVRELKVPEIVKGKRMEPVFLAELAGSNLDGALIQRKRFRVL